MVQRKIEDDQTKKVNLDPLSAVPKSINEAFLRMDHGTRNYLQRSLKELTDIKEALDKVLVVAITDLNGVITYVNDRFCELYKYQREEVIGKNHRLFKSGEHSQEFYRNLWETISHGKIFSGEIKNRAKDGSSYWAYMVIVPFLDEEGKPYQYVSFRTDITSVKEAEAAKIKLLKAEASIASAEAAVQARDRFVSMAAHELKTPITSLQLVLDLLVKRSKDQYTAEEMKQIRHLLDTAVFQTRRLTSIINDLLDVSRIAAGKLKLNLEYLNLDELIRNLISHSKEDLDAAGCEVNLDIQGPIRGLCDKARLEQVMINLLSNAMKYGQRKPIHIFAETTDHCVIIKVQDHGIGISKDFQKKIFQRFERANTTEHYKGIGLGLWITSQIIDAHNGKIRVESELGQGSTFIVEIPIQNKSDWNKS